MKHQLLVLLTLCASLSVRADELQSILQMLAARPLVRAEFSQEKTLPALEKPLHSEGQLVFAVQDNGNAGDPAAWQDNGRGLAIMRARMTELEGQVRWVIAQGCRVEVCVPDTSVDD